MTAFSPGRRDQENLPREMGSHSRQDPVLSKGLEAMCLWRR